MGRGPEHLGVQDASELREAFVDDVLTDQAHARAKFVREATAEIEIGRPVRDGLPDQRLERGGESARLALKLRQERAFEHLARLQLQGGLSAIERFVGERETARRHATAGATEHEFGLERALALGVIAVEQVEQPERTLSAELFERLAHG